jgi:hypothetical protein
MRDAADRALVAGLVVVSLSTYAAMRATSRTSNGDPFDSRLFWLTWLLFPLVGFFVAAYHPRRHGPRTWAVSLIGPWMALVFLEGAVLLDASEGASFWVVGEVFLLFEMLWILGITALGHLTTRVGGG